MSQHDYDLANAPGASFRSDANNVLDAVVSQNSGASEPTTKFAYMIWADSTTGILKQRNAANSAWINLWTIADGVSLSDMKVITATYDLTTATGTQAITGAGFAPDAVVIFQASSNTDQASWGMATNGETTRCILKRSNGFTGATNVIHAEPVLNNIQTATVSVWGSDGITLSWTKSASPTGTANLQILFIKH